MNLNNLFARKKNNIEIYKKYRKSIQNMFKNTGSKYWMKLLFGVLFVLFSDGYWENVGGVWDCYFFNDLKVV